jgi:hypothetical protein
MISHEHSNWFHVLLTCRRFYCVGKISFDPSIFQNRALLWACKTGNLTVVKSLLSDARVDPSCLDNEAIQLACAHGHDLVVKELLLDKRVDPSDNFSATVRYAR